MLYILLMIFSCAALNAGNGISYNLLNPHGFLREQIEKGDYLGARKSIKMGGGIHYKHNGMSTIELIAVSPMQFEQKVELTKTCVDKNVPVTQESVKVALKKDKKFGNYLKSSFQSQSNATDTTSDEKSSRSKKIENAMKSKGKKWIAQVKVAFRKLFKKA